MHNELKEIVDAIRNYAGVYRKKPIKEVVDRLSRTFRFGNQLPNYGDDAAVIPWHGEYLLLATDGMMTGLLISEPYAAGKAAVMVAVNDIYAMGGRPIGMVNVMASGDVDQRAKIVEGIEKGCQKLQVPMMGGHLHPDAPRTQPALSVAILGSAKKLLRSHLAIPGEKIVAAVDLEGKAGCRSVASWDANSGKSPEALIRRLETLPEIAEDGLCRAAKDISNAGLVGTIAIMMENSRTGAVIDLSAVPKPDVLALKDWLLCFQSFGFILSVSPKNLKKVLDRFMANHIAADVIGTVTDNRIVAVTTSSESRVLIDFNSDHITGIRCVSDDNHR
jgi:selenophosphate synthetase-related protein